MNRKFPARKHAFHGAKELKPIELSLPRRSFWRDRVRQIWAFFCPLCNVPRRIPYQPRPGFKHMIQVGLTAVIFTLATWSWFEWKGMVSFLPLWTFFEVIYRSRVRAALACNHCGFDPYLYLNDVPRAREVVENHWRKKFAEKGIPYPEATRTGASRSESAKNAGKTVRSAAPAQASSQPATKSSPSEMVT